MPMHLHQSGPHDGRRRRVLSDATLAGPSVTTAPTIRREPSRQDPRAQRSGNYGKAEFLEQQPYAAKLIPTRGLVFVVLLGLGIGVVAALELLYLWVPQITHSASRRIAAFDLSGPGSLATWFRSILAAWAGVWAILVYSIRRFKVDDYRGRYRIWLWVALACWLMSLDQTAQLRWAFRDLMVATTGVPVSGTGAFWWIVPYVLISAAVGVPLLAEMRPSRLSTTTIVLAALCYLLATAARFDWFVVDDQRQRVMIEHGAIVFGNFLFFIAITLYSRHVLLDAQGLLRRRKGKEPLTAAKRESARKKAPASPTTKQDTPEDSTADGDRTFAVHAPHDRVEQPPADVLPTPVPESGAPSATSTPAVEQAADEQTSDAVKGSENRKLSKAERRRLRAEARAGQTPSIPRETLKPS